jgi:hypothetical protein
MCFKDHFPANCAFRRLKAKINTRWKYQPLTISIVSEILERHAAAWAKLRPRLQPHPYLRDDAEKDAGPGEHQHGLVQRFDRPTLFFVQAGEIARRNRIGSHSKPGLPSQTSVTEMATHRRPGLRLAARR